MSAAQLSEITRELILTQIQNNIVATLARVRIDRSDPSVNTDPPRSFFIFDGAHTYQCPAIFVVVDSGEIPEEQFGSNQVNAIMKVYVSAVVEGQEAKSLTIKAERYQAALFMILHEMTVNDPANNVKLYSRVQRFRFSELYTKSRQTENLANFRKEVALELEVKHFENLTS